MNFETDVHGRIVERHHDGAEVIADCDDVEIFAVEEHSSASDEHQE